MKITPLDLRKPDFRRTFKGYDIDEVRGMLAAAADTLEEVLRENMDLKTRLTEVNERLKNYQNMENTLNETLILAQKAGESARQASQREAELIVAKAEVEADKLLDGARSRLRELKYEIERLDEQRQSYLVKMRSIVASQWKLLQEEFEEETVARQEKAKKDAEILSAVPERPAGSKTVEKLQAEESAPDLPEKDDTFAGGGRPMGAALELDGFGQNNETETETESEQDSVKNLSRKLGEFLRAKSSEDLDLDAESFPAEQDLASPAAKGLDDEDSLAWGNDDDDKADLFWGQVQDEEDDERLGGGKRGKKK